MTLEIPGFGPVIYDENLGWYGSRELPVAVLGGLPCRIIIEGYEDEEFRDDFKGAIRNFLEADPSVLKEATPHVYQYYQDITALAADDEERIDIASADDVWNHVEFGRELIVSRRQGSDRSVYISVECECAWEPEHGLQIVFENGRRVNKIGPYDGHLSNADAFDDSSLENVVYRG